jgi:hypothetical protein
MFCIGDEWGLPVIAEKAVRIAALTVAVTRVYRKNHTPGA